MSHSLAQVFAVMFGGAFGALARFLLSTKVTEKYGHAFPFGTLSVNVLGSFLMGFMTIIIVERLQLDPLFRLAIFVGFLGAFTTVSAFSLDTLNLFEQGNYLHALINIFITVLFSVFAVWLGVLMGKMLN
ncbi:MAG: CrcB protein [Cocleimonas sp.]